MSAIFTKAMVENNSVILPLEEAKELLFKHKESDHFVVSTFKDLYYTDEENDLIDTLRTNIAEIKDPYKHAIAMSALIRACMKKRPVGFLPIQGSDIMMGVKIYKRRLRSNFWKLLKRLTWLYLITVRSIVQNMAMQWI